MSYKQLTENERYQIYTLLKVGFSLKAIADELNRHPSTISRELKRNKGLKGYRPRQAQRLAGTRRKQAPKACKLTAAAIGWMTCLVRQELSPQQAVTLWGINGLPGATQAGTAAPRDGVPVVICRQGGWR